MIFIGLMNMQEKEWLCKEMGGKSCQHLHTVLFYKQNHFPDIYIQRDTYVSHFYAAYE